MLVTGAFCGVRYVLGATEGGAAATSLVLDRRWRDPNDPDSEVSPVGKRVVAVNGYAFNDAIGGAPRITSTDTTHAHAHAPPP